MTLKSVSAVNSSTAFVYMVYCPIEIVGTIKKCFTDAGFEDVRDIIWYKSNVTHEAKSDCFIKAHEVLILAFKTPQRIVWRLPKGHRDRHGIVIGPCLMSQKYQVDRKVLNFYEKPAWISRLFASIFCPSDLHVLVLGAGAGGDILGALANGNHVAALELNPEQFAGLVGRMESLKGRFASAEEDGVSLKWQVVLPEAFAGTLGDSQPIGCAQAGKMNPSPLNAKSYADVVKSIALAKEVSEPATRAKFKCISCSAVLVGDDKRCSTCGGPLCDEHAILTEGTLFCPSHAVPPPTEAAAPESAQ